MRRRKKTAETSLSTPLKTVEITETLRINIIASAPAVEVPTVCSAPSLYRLTQSPARHLQDGQHLHFNQREGWLAQGHVASKWRGGDMDPWIHGPTPSESPGVPFLLPVSTLAVCWWNGRSLQPVLFPGCPSELQMFCTNPYTNISFSVPCKHPGCQTGSAEPLYQAALCCTCPQVSFWLTCSPTKSHLVCSQTSCLKCSCYFNALI